jgi:hypothetical protein
MSGVHTTEKPPGQELWEAYTYAWGRIKRAKEAGCEIEVVAIVESIISDRLRSYLKGQRPETDWDGAGFNTLIEATRAHVNGSVVLRIAASPASVWPDVTTTDLFGELVQWRERRNAAIHRVINRDVDRSPASPYELGPYLEQVGRDGEKLARLVTKWHKRSLAEFQRAVTNACD